MDELELLQFSKTPTAEKNRIGDASQPITFAEKILPLDGHEPFEAIILEPGDALTTQTESLAIFREKRPDIPIILLVDPVEAGEKGCEVWEKVDLIIPRQHATPEFLQKALWWATYKKKREKEMGSLLEEVKADNAMQHMAYRKARDDVRAANRAMEAMNECNQLLFNDQEEKEYIRCLHNSCQETGAANGMGWLSGKKWSAERRAENRRARRKRAKLPQGNSNQKQRKGFLQNGDRESSSVRRVAAPPRAERR
jgi:hypothetical protein